MTIDTKRQPKRFQYLLAFLVCFGIFMLGINNSLTLYIHPRYIYFTMIGALVGGLLSLIATFRYKFEGKKTKIEYRSILEIPLSLGSWAVRNGAWIVLIAVLAFLFLPKKPLLSEVANNKRTQNYWEGYEDLENISWSKDPEQINEVVGLVSNPDMLKSLIDSGKELELSGFVIGVPKSDEFNIARFVLGCCAVDASPVSLPIKANSLPDLKQDDWVSVKGNIVIDKSEGVNLAKLNAKQVLKIGQPERPYEYLRYK